MCEPAKTGYGATPFMPAKMLYPIESGMKNNIQTLIVQKIRLALSVVDLSATIMPIP